MVESSTRSTFWRGFWAGMPFTLAVSPFGLAFGVLATEAGLNLIEVMSMSVLVIAGAAQFTALSQMQENAPVIVVLIAALAVNLRMAMYSASLAPYLGPAPFWKRAVAAYILVDNSYAVGVAEFEKKPEMPIAKKMAFFIGCAIPVWFVWYIATFAGALLGKSIPAEYSLDFVVPLAFLAILAPMLKTLAHIAAALTSIIVALTLSFLPYSLGLLIAAALAMAVGAEIERRSGLVKS